MKFSFHRFIAPGLVLAIGPAARAELNPAIVPADAKWVVHVDLAALRDTALGQKLIQYLPTMKLTDESDAIRPNARKIMETVGTVTAFGSDLSGKPEAVDGALVLQGTADLRKIAEGLAAQMSLTHPDDFTEVKDLPFEAYAISREVFVGFPSEPIVLVSKSRAQLLQALEVFRGKSPSLAKSKSPLVGLLPTGRSYYLSGAAMLPANQQMFKSNGPEARILQMAQSGSVAVGEERESAVARVKLVASSADVAGKLVKIVEGITAMVALAETNDEPLAEFIDSLKVQRSDAAVTLGFSYPTARILQMMDDVQRNQTEPAPAPSVRSIEGEVIAQWTADQDLGADAPTERNFATRTIEHVSLAPGVTLVLTGERRNGEHARWDYIELTPETGGGGAQRFEAEYMRLQGYSIERVQSASGGEVIKTEARGTARLRFTGAAGRYTITARYVDETDGKAPLALSLLPAETSNP
jgi:hypothetical protein